MDLLIRKIQTDRGNGFIQTFSFTTYACIWEDQPNPTLNKLFGFFCEVMMYGVPNDAGKKSVSGAKQLIVNTEHRSCDLIQLAQDSDYENREQFQHQILQNYLMYHDPHTVAIEIPVWDEEHIGHIDCIRFVDDKLWICDFKPNAAQETKAASQVMRYRHLLAKQLNIKEQDMIGIYFDNKNSYFIT